MQGFGAFLGKEVREIFRTWRMWVLPGLFVFIGLTSPVLARFTPQLVASVAGGDTGIVIELPEPTTVDAYMQFSKNAVQMVLIAIIIIAAGLIASERKSGTAVLVLTKPLDRAGFVVAKFAANVLLLVGATVLGAALCVGVTAVMFDTTGIVRFAAATGLWLLFASMFVAVMILFSTILGSQAGASGAGVAFYLVISVLAAWGPTRDHSPAGLMSAGDRLLLGHEVQLAWPIATSILMTVLAVAAAVLVFRRQEL
jgi:ABC-2 type transport system permease protein